MSDDKKELEESDHINVKVLGPSNYGIVQFKIKKHTPMRKLMNAYCDREKLDINSVKFRFDGEPVTEMSTPLTLKLEEGDTIEVFQESKESEYITLKVVGPTNYEIFQFKIKKHTPMRKLMHAFSDRSGLDIGELRFRFGGEPIYELCTPSSLEMQEGDIVDVFKESEYITLQVQTVSGSGLVQFKIKKHTPMRKLMYAYSDRSGLEFEEMRFQFDGAPIDEFSTPFALQLQEGDIIVAYKRQPCRGTLF